MEILDLYNKDKELTNLQISRGVKVPNGYYRLVVHICIFNELGQMLIQKRHPLKKWGNKWDISVGGCVIAGETSDVAAMREMKEEIGLDIDLKDLRCNFTFTFDDGFDDIYLVNVKDLDLTKLKLQESEVIEVKWASLDDILEMSKNDEFITYYESYLKLLFEFRQASDMYKY